MLIINFIIFFFLIILFIIIIKKLKKYILKLYYYSFYYNISKKKYNKNYTFRDTFKIALIIPTTSRNQNYINIEETTFLKILIPSFLKTYDKNSKYIYTFYLGYDDDDIFYIKNKDKIIEYINNLNIKRINIKFFSIKQKSNNVCYIWNLLFNYAINDKNDYIYQLGDDIEFIDSNWEKYFINQLLNNDNIGVVGPTDINNRCGILTQSFVHNTHYKIFEFYFPYEFKNWGIDDWIDNVYKKRWFDLFKKNKNRAYKFIDIKVNNKGGKERYIIDYNNGKIYYSLIKKGKKTLNNYLKKNKITKDI